MAGKLTRRDFLKVGSLSLGALLIPARTGQNSLGEQGEGIFRIIVAPNFNMEVYHGKSFLGTVNDPSLQEILHQLAKRPKSLASKVTDLIPEFPLQNSGKPLSGLSNAFIGGREALLPLASYSLKHRSIEGLVLPQIAEPHPYREFVQKELSITPLAGGRIGNYYWRIGLDYHRISAPCIPRERRIRHINVMVKRIPNTILFNAHLAGWREGNRLCIGLYESRSRFCWSWCTPDNPWQVWYVIFILLLSLLLLYVAYQLAVALAAAMASAALPLLLAL